MQLDLVESIVLVEKNGVSFAKHVFVEREEDLGKALEHVGKSAVLKLVSSVSHKTDFGGVRLGVESVSEAKSFFKEMKEKCLSRKALFKGMLVQEELEGIEIIVGSKLDAQFGPVLLFGLGGTMVEIMKDVSLRLIPVSRKDAKEMIREIKGFPVLEGFRGKPGVDLRALEDVLLKVSGMVEREGLKELDLNPLFGCKEKVVGADARVVK